MANLTKEQIRIYTIIPCILMLIAFFIPVDAGEMFGGFGSYKVSLWTLMTGEMPIGFWATFILILFLLTPIYLILYVFRDAPQLKPLAPVLGISPKVAYVIPIVLFVLLLFIGCMKAGITPLWMYLLGAIAIYFIGTSLVGKNTD
jgi:hypothetical protein